MSKTYKIVSALVIIVVVAIGGYYFYQQHRARKAGMLTENIVHRGRHLDGRFHRAHRCARAAGLRHD